jgi:hypothetical protein
MKKILIIVALSIFSITTFSQGNDCQLFSNKIKNCESYECTFPHPFTGEKSSRKIIGSNNDKCLYVESMPNNGKMLCDFEKTNLKDISEFYKQALEELSEEDRQMSFSTENIPQDPLSRSLENGTCCVLGYGNDDPSCKEKEKLFLIQPVTTKTTLANPSSFPESNSALPQSGGTSAFDLLIQFIKNIFS